MFVAAIGRSLRREKILLLVLCGRGAADRAVVGGVGRRAAEIRARHDRIDVLANNAGAIFANRRLTPDGYEQTFALNRLAPFLLTHLLRDRLAGGRVVTTASDAHT